MKKNKVHDLENQNAEDIKEMPGQTEENTCQESSKAENAGENKEMADTLEKLDAKTKQCEEYFDKLQRTMAEFDNYKKRTCQYVLHCLELKWR